MLISKTLNVPANHRLTIDVPPEVPAGTVIVTFMPITDNFEIPANVATAKKERVLGCAKGQFWMSDDFDAPLEDFKDYM